MKENRNPMYKNFFSEEEYFKKIGQVKMIKSASSLQPGDLCPEITLTNHRGEEVNLTAMLKNKNIVLFFYPGDKEGLRYPELIGCTPQACNFRESMTQFEKNNTIIYGVSFQPTEKQKAFAQREGLNFEILSDKEQRLAKALGISIWQTSSKKEEFPVRQTYIIAQGGIIKKIYEDIDSNEINEHVLNVLACVKKLNAAAKFI